MSDSTRQKMVSATSGTMIALVSARTSEDPQRSPATVQVVTSIDITDLKDDLKQVLEAQAIEIHFRSLLLADSPSDDPFDAIYLSRLTPDRVQQGDVNRITAYATIRDLSDDLEFVDEWD